MIVITGAAGFIGSAMVNKLNNKGFSNLVLVDDFSNPQKQKNLQYKVFALQVHRNEFYDWLLKNAGNVEFVIHLGARTDTAEKDENIFRTLNYEYSVRIWNICTEKRIPLIYASSAATYGSGEHGFSDDHQMMKNLQPLNLYAKSKHQFDLFVLEQEQTPPFWAGMKFFNVYGPNEYHKGRMASVVYHAYHQIKQTGKLQLFRSHRTDVADGMQKRDFIYVKDVVDVLFYFMVAQPAFGIYNVGTGQASSFLELAYALFEALQIEPQIEFIDTPVDIRDSYQYFTQADVSKLRSAGYQKQFATIKQGVFDYVHTYLMSNEYY